MTLGADGSGSYEFCDGKIRGTVRGDKLTGIWTQTFPCGGAVEGSGSLEFTLSPDGKSWSSRWRYGAGGGWRTDWYGTCVAGPCAGEGP